MSTNGPPSHSPKTLALFFDGTGNAFADETTNVVRLFSALEKKKRNKQLCYYQPGIGTYVSPTVLWANTFRRIAKLADQAFAWYVLSTCFGTSLFDIEDHFQVSRRTRR